MIAKDDNEVVDNNYKDNSIKVDDFISKFVGTYEYEYIYENFLCVPEEAGRKARYGITLQLNADGTYVYGKGGDCTGGTTAKGKYSLGRNVLYLYNDECELNEECQYPNCQKIIELEYEIIDNEININDFDIINNKTIVLEKK